MDFDPQQIIDIADKQMYEEKQNFKHETQQEQEYDYLF